MIKLWSFSIKALCRTYLTTCEVSIPRINTASQLELLKKNLPEALLVGAAFLGMGTQSSIP